MSKKPKQMEIDDFLKDENVNPITGEIITAKLGEKIEVRTLRENGTVRIQWDYSNVPTRAEQHTAHLTNLNYLVERFKPDELGAYVASRATREPLPSNITSETRAGFTAHPELNLQEAYNVVYNAKVLFKELDPKIQAEFASPLEFIKFIDNPANAEKMVKLGLIQKKQVEDLKTKQNVNNPIQPTTTTKEEEKGKSS